MIWNGRLSVMELLGFTNPSKQSLQAVSSAEISSRWLKACKISAWMVQLVLQQTACRHFITLCFCFGYFAWCIICRNSGFILYPWWSFNKSIHWVQWVFSSEIKSRSLFNGNYRIAETRRASVPHASISNLVLFSVLVVKDSRFPGTLDDVGEFEMCIALLYNCLSLVASFWP